MNSATTFVRTTLAGIATLGLGLTLSTPAVARVNCVAGRKPQCLTQQPPTKSVALPPRSVLTGVTTFATDAFGNPIRSGPNAATANTILDDDIPNVYVFLPVFLPNSDIIDPDSLKNPLNMSDFSNLRDSGNVLFEDTLFLLAQSVPEGSNPEFTGLNLFFENDQVDPNISVYRPNNTSSRSFSTTSGDTLSLNGQMVQSPGTSSFLNNAIGIKSFLDNGNTTLGFDFNPPIDLSDPNDFRYPETVKAVADALESGVPITEQLITAAARQEASKANKLVTDEELTNIVAVIYQAIEEATPRQLVTLDLFEVYEPLDLVSSDGSIGPDGQPDFITLFALLEDQPVFVTTSVPEPSSTAGTLVFGMLSLGYMLKRQTRVS